MVTGMKASLVKSILFCRFDFGTMIIIIKLNYKTKFKKQSLRIENKRKQINLTVYWAGGISKERGTPPSDF